MKQMVLIFALQAAMIVHSQDSTFTVKAGEDVSVLYRQVYRYPQFSPGKIYFINDSARSLFNYNRLDGKIEFISEKNDTLLIADEKSARQVIIGKDSFYINKGNYFLSIGDYGFARLFLLETIKLLDEKNIGSYGIPSSTHTIENRRTIMSLQTVTIQLNKDLVFSKRVEYYFSHGDTYFPATKKNIFKLLDAKEKPLAENFIAAKSINFKKQEDLQNLFQYIGFVRKP